jgi:hypothetical protein
VFGQQQISSNALNASLNQPISTARFSGDAAKPIIEPRCRFFLADFDT